MFVATLFHAGRLTASRPSRMVDLLQAGMGATMAVMLVHPLDPRLSGWLAVGFVAPTAWFARRALRSSGRAPCDLTGLACGGAMVFMLAAGHHATSGAALVALLVALLLALARLAPALVRRFDAAVTCQLAMGLTAIYMLLPPL
jgi:hypothetical protein